MISVSSLLSGAMERGHDMVYVCYDNGAYMNTGIQRSSATPMYADTTTTPVGKQSNGKDAESERSGQLLLQIMMSLMWRRQPLPLNFKDIHSKV